MALTTAAATSGAGVASDRKAMQSASEADVTMQARDGSGAAYAELYRRHADAATSTARYLLRNRHDADDVVSEAFASVLSALRNGAGPRDENFRTYLLACVRNGCTLRSRQRGQSELRGLSEFTDQADKLEDPERFVEADAVTSAYASLPDPWKRVLWLTEVEDRPLEEVAASLHLRKSAAAALSYRAHQGLAEAYLSQSVLAAYPPLTSCSAVAPRLARYVRGRCRAGQRRTITSHLSDCAACTALADELGTVNHDLRGLMLPPFALAALLDRLKIAGASGAGRSAIVAKSAASHSVAGVARSAMINGARSVMQVWTLPLQVAALVGVSALAFAPEVATSTSTRPTEAPRVTSSAPKIRNDPIAGALSTSTSPHPAATRVEVVQQNLPPFVAISPSATASPDTSVSPGVTGELPSSATADSSATAVSSITAVSSATAASTVRLTLPSAVAPATAVAIAGPIVTVPAIVVPPLQPPAPTAPPVTVAVATAPAIPVTSPVGPPVTTSAVPPSPGVPGIALGSATRFAVLAKTAVTSTGATLVTGDVARSARRTR